MAKKNSSRDDSIELFKPLTPNEVRVELDGKIEKKVSYHVFYWAIGIFVLTTSGMFAYINKVHDDTFTYINKMSDKININDGELIRIETKLENKK